MFCSESGSVVHRYLVQPQVHVYHGATLEDASVLGCADHSACPSGFLRVSTPFPAETWTHVAVVITRPHATATYGSAAVYWDGPKHVVSACPDAGQPGFDHKLALMRAYRAADANADTLIDGDEFARLLDFFVFLPPCFCPASAPCMSKTI